MHRIFSRPAAEKLLIVVRGVTYPHVAQLKVLKTHRIIIILMQENNSISFSCFSVWTRVIYESLEVTTV